MKKLKYLAGILIMVLSLISFTSCGEDDEICVVSVISGFGGTATASAESVEEGGSVTLTATANSGYEFVNWTLNEVVVSTENPYTVTITENSEFVANFEAEETEHEYVDLGLSVNWATCNVGANTPEEYGDYFAWGETEPKEIYNWETYKWCNGTYDSMAKYSGYDILELSDDAARVNWGGEWRMPTSDELSELMDTNNCTWEWTTQNGVNGYRVTSKINGNSIFLPAAGCRNSSGLNNVGRDGCYWSSLVDANYSRNAFGLYFYSSDVRLYNDYRYYGISVRAVCE